MYEHEYGASPSQPVITRPEVNEGCLPPPSMYTLSTLVAHRSLCNSDEYCWYSGYSVRSGGRSFVGVCIVVKS